MRLLQIDTKCWCDINRHKTKARSMDLRGTLVLFGLRYKTNHCLFRFSSDSDVRIQEDWNQHVIKIESIILELCSQVNAVL